MSETAGERFDRLKVAYLAHLDAAEALKDDPGAYVTHIEASVPLADQMVAAGNEAHEEWLSQSRWRRIRSALYTHPWWTLYLGRVLIGLWARLERKRAAAGRQESRPEGVIPPVGAQ